MVYEGRTLPSGDEIRNTGLAARGRTLLPARVLRYFRRPGLAVSDFPAPSIETRSTAALVDLNDEIATEFNLGPKAGELAEQVMRLIAEQPGGLAGFLEKLKECGCGAPAASGLGRAYVPLTVRQVKKLAGTPFIKEVAKYLEIPQGFASKVLGAAIPKIAALLDVQNPTSEEVSPDALVFPTLFALADSRGRAGVQTFASKERNPLLRMDVRYVARLRLIVPVATLLITGGLLGYAISPRTANSAAAGLVNVANTAAVTCPLVPGLGTCEITGDFAVRAGWTKNLTAEFDSYDSANPKLHFAGTILTTNRTIQVAGYSTRKIDSPQSARFNETENHSKNRSLVIN
jgi:uncharacterized protein YidB (DUF937 family)